jgi:Fur family ferric uptake transcriptional regulator
MAAAMNKNKQTEKLLQSAGLRQTEPRAAILNVLLAANAPLTREQIAERIGDSAPNKTTIYRTLMNLVAKGVVHKAYLEQRTWHFELARHCGQFQCHPHFTCTQCQQTHCMTSVSAPLLELPKGYHMERQSIRITGICPACRK